ncbi:hypothetical protein FA95DRAFT_1561114 [Auriscalpium vulgare]|uniref:Uncharacterized protein n=1 Tax=Auriscalpium vulgare TaxID=40419 RepID=A0ACB8RPG6_9AGAM|nr:hypothetical protein FA95DRAFT_1561114 [Auriscalpium vulgare]
MKTFGIIAGAALSLIAGASSAMAQGPNEECAAGWDWTFNSLGQSPCVIEALLEDNCGNACACNTIVYSLASACSACETLSWEDWNHWFTTNNCTLLQMDLSGFEIPDTTRVPLWAFANLGSTWNSTAAESIGTYPETPYVNSSATPTPVSSSPASTGHHGLSRGAKAAIAGGVVGGAAALLVVLFLVLSRRKTRIASRGFGARVRARYFDMKVAPGVGLITERESVRMQEGPFGREVSSVAVPEKSAA